jgi:ankyrin repeat protein
VNAVNLVGKHTADTALGMAAREGQHAMLQLLLSYGADVHHADRHQGYTVLHWAAHMGHLGIARMLVDAGCNPLQRDRSQLRHLPR